MGYFLLDVIIAYLIDLAAGDPYWFPHPVRFIGWLIRCTERFLRNPLKDKYERTLAAGLDEELAKEKLARDERYAGTLLLFFVAAVCFLIAFLILKLAGMIHPILFHVFNIYFIYSALAAKCLGDEAKKVYKVLLTGDIIEARKKLSMLVGRQTENLDEKEITRGVIETTAENTVDGIISPLFYAFIGSLFGIGAPLVYAFKAISTLDSTVGYMNEKYINFGRLSAKTDDVANYLPARLSGILIPLSSLICGMGFSKSFKIMKRDRRNHKSPNCAYSEAAVAGALGIRMGGNNVYFGKVVEKPTMGDPDKEIKAEMIPMTIRLMYVTSFIALILGGITSYFILEIIY
jgi:adenosylcobinamide-phosphate synthase